MGQQLKRQVRMVIFLLFGFALFAKPSMCVQAEEIVEKKSFSIMKSTDFSSDGNGVITAFAGNKNAEVIVIPQMVNGQIVKGIGEKVFEGCENLTTVIIPDTVERFGKFSFGSCTALSTIAVYNETDGDTAIISNYEDGAVFLSEKMQAVESSAFFNCLKISKFAVADTNTTFKAVSVTESEQGKGEMLLSKDKTKLYRFAPGYHYTGSGLYPLPFELTEILPYACEGVGLNGGFKIPMSVTKIGDHAFYACHNLNDLKFELPSSVEYIGSCAFAYNRNLELILPESVKEIGTYSFAYCSNVQVKIGKTQITTVPEYAFYESDNLHELTMPKTLKRIEAYAFYGCNNLNNIYFLGKTLEKIGTGVFQNCNNLHEIELPKGVTNIEDSMFDGCWNLNKIVLPDTVTTIGEKAFKDCKNIHVLVIPPKVKYIANSSFSGANQDAIDTSKNVYSQQFIKGKLPLNGTVFRVGSLKYKVTKSKAKNGTVAVCGVKSKKIKSAAIGSTVWYKGYKFKITQVSNNTFKKCSKLTRVTIGKNVTSIGSNAFNGAKKLKQIVIKSTKLKSVGKNAIKGISKRAVIKVPKKKYTKYKVLFKSKTGYKTTMKIKK